MGPDRGRGDPASKARVRVGSLYDRKDLSCTHDVWGSVGWGVIRFVSELLDQRDGIPSIPGAER